MAPHGTTIATLWLIFNRHEQDMRERLKAIDDRITTAAFQAVPREVYEERHLALRERVRNLEDTAERALIYRRNLTIAIAGALVASMGAVVASLLAVLVH